MYTNSSGVVLSLLSIDDSVLTSLVWWGEGIVCKEQTCPVNILKHYYHNNKNKNKLATYVCRTIGTLMSITEIDHSSIILWKDTCHMDSLYIILSIKTCGPKQRRNLSLMIDLTCHIYVNCATYGILIVFFCNKTILSMNTNMSL